MGYVYPGRNPFACLWCILWIDLLSRTYGPWAACMVIGFLLFVLLIFVVLEALSYGGASYDTWWTNVIFFFMFALILAITAVNCRPKRSERYTEYNRPPYTESRTPSAAAGVVSGVSGTAAAPQRPLLPVPLVEV